MIFDINMDGNFARKARFFTGGHTADPPAAITYSRVLSRDRVRIAFMLVELNYIGVFAANIDNVYLNAPCHDKIWKNLGLSLAVSKYASC